MAPKGRMLESSEMASKGRMLESSEMAPKGHVSESAEMAASLWISLVQCRWHDKHSRSGSSCKICCCSSASWGAKDRAWTAATAVVPTDAKSVGVGETSRQKSVDVEQLNAACGGAVSQKWGRSDRSVRCDFSKSSQLRERWSMREVLPASSSGKLVEGFVELVQLFLLVWSQTHWHWIPLSLRLDIQPNKSGGVTRWPRQHCTRLSRRLGRGSGLRSVFPQQS